VTALARASGEPVRLLALRWDAEPAQAEGDGWWLERVAPLSQGLLQTRSQLAQAACDRAGAEPTTVLCLGPETGRAAQLLEAQGHRCGAVLSSLVGPSSFSSTGTGRLHGMPTRWAARVSSRLSRLPMPEGLLAPLNQLDSERCLVRHAHTIVLSSPDLQRAIHSRYPCTVDRTTTIPSIEERHSWAENLLLAVQP
jgi:hypothetical protein